MAATKGNQWWNLRSKHGRDRLFKTPDLLWEAAMEYFEWIDNNPLVEIDYVGKDATLVEKPHIRPYTIQWLCLYFDANTQFFNQFENSLKDKKDTVSKDFSLICMRIRETIYKQKFEGAACGFYNANIIARDLGLTDRQDITTDGESIQVLLLNDRNQKV